MSNQNIKLYHKYVRIGKNIIYIYRIWYYPQFQPSTEVLGTDCPWIRRYYYTLKSDSMTLQLFSDVGSDFSDFG